MDERFVLILCFTYHHQIKALNEKHFFPLFFSPLHFSGEKIKLIKEGRAHSLVSAIGKPIKMAENRMPEHAARNAL